MTKVALTSLVACFAFIAATSSSSASTVRTMPLESGMNEAKFRVPHQSKSLPPAIVFSTEPSKADCVVASYNYGAKATRGRFRIKVRCQKVPRKARATMSFRAPYIRQFDLHNGTSRIRIRADKPRGDVRPLGSLTTAPRETDCEVSPTGSKTGPRRFSATARMTCRDLPAGAKGIFGLGGLVSKGDLGKAKRSSASVTSTYEGPSTKALINAGQASISISADKCDAAKVIEVKGQKTFRWKTCRGGPFVLGPWASQWVGIGTPPADCEAGWQRSFGWQEAPTQWLFSKFNVRMWTNPDTDWYSWSFGLVTNWQFSGDIEFRFEWNCYQIG